MLVSRNWLSEYVSLSAPTAEIAQRLTMSGLNHESTSAVGADECIDLEVTSNRTDCLGHLGVAREIAVLYNVPLQSPAPAPLETTEQINSVFQLRVEVPELCPRYTARLIRGVKVGLSPLWLRERLETIGVAPINNVVDVTNYVMFECGQPLHAFDFSRLAGQQIVVRNPRPDETMIAIDHKAYSLLPGMCVIADQEKAVAIAGVMGGAESEVSEQTRDVLIESAMFQPLSIRNTARRLNLHSPSSYRFERHLDPRGVDWASRRCCELILKIAGGQLLSGCCDAGSAPPASTPITLRWSRISQVLGIEVTPEFARQTLLALGLESLTEQSDRWTVVPPSWRPDLTREIDLVEEIGRIYGYDRIPDTVAVPMAASYRTQRNRINQKIRNTMVSCGFDEAMTPSLVPDIWANAFSPWTAQSALVSNQPMLGVLEKASQNIGAVNQARRSLVPSLLEAKRINEYRANTEVELFEIAKVYLPQADRLPHEPWMLAIVSSRSYETVKGVLEEMLRILNPEFKIVAQPCEETLLDVSRSAKLILADRVLGWLGQVSTSGRKQFGLRQSAVVAEIDLSSFDENAILIPRQRGISEYPAVTRDFNFVVDESVSWSALEDCVREAAGELCELIQYRETFRDAQKDGPLRKRLLLTVQWRSPTGTLTSAQVDGFAQRIIDQCNLQLSASLVA